MTQDRIGRSVAVERTGPTGRTTGMNEHGHMREGDIVEFTVRGQRRTAEVMLLTTDDTVLLDLFDGDRPAWAKVMTLEDLAIYRPEHVDALVAA
jgi:hypothetical protein